MKNMKPLFVATSIFIFLLAGLAIFSGLGQRSVQAQQPVNPTFEPVRSVTVTGFGQVNVVPDRSFVVLGVQTQAETAGAALTQNNTQMQDLITALRAAGVQNEDIQSRTLNLFPRYENQRPIEPPTGGEIVGYTAINTVELHIRQIASLGAIIDTAVEAGANTIEGIRFEVAEPNQALDAARETAMGDALRKARQLADLADADLGNVLTITEYSRPPSPVFQESFAADMAASVPVQPGTELITIEVTVTWYLQ